MNQDGHTAQSITIPWPFHSFDRYAFTQEMSLNFLLKAACDTK